MKNTTLIIMAAGIGSRFGNGIKQLAKVGQNGEIIMDYSIYDAVEAGFNKVVFIIRKNMKDEFMSVIGNRISKYVKTEYVYQELDNLPDGFCAPEGRTKPWGTAHALLCCKDVIKGPFLVINADDYYGKKIFKKMHDYLVDSHKETEKQQLAMAGYVLKNTLSKVGSVTRGICVSDKNNLVQIIETTGIRINESGIILCDNENIAPYIKRNDLVSMNMWAGFPSFFSCLEKEFTYFLNHTDNINNKECLIPIVVGDMLKNKAVDVMIIPTDDRWIGITYKDDLVSAQKEFDDMVTKKEYPEKLWN